MTEVHGTQELTPDSNTSLAFCRNKEWLMNKMFKMTVIPFTNPTVVGKPFFCVSQFFRSGN